jgi:hypothetical protein
VSENSIAKQIWKMDSENNVGKRHQKTVLENGIRKQCWKMTSENGVNKWRQKMH